MPKAKDRIHPDKETAYVFLAPEAVPDWHSLRYPDIDEVKAYKSHPKTYTWPQLQRQYTYAHDYARIRPDLYLHGRVLFRTRDGGRPWADDISPATTPLGPRRVNIDHLGPSIKHLPRYIPPTAPIIADWSNEHHDAPDAHGIVMRCHWCSRPFISLGVVMNAQAKKLAREEPRLLDPDDPDQRIRHSYCNRDCQNLWRHYVGEWWDRVGKPLFFRREGVKKQNYATRHRLGRTVHKYELNQKYKVRWDFLSRYVSPEGMSCSMNEIMPRGQKTPPVTKVQRNKLRQQIYRDTEDMVRMAKAVLAGDHEWNSSQVQVFKSLMNKVLPDAHVAEEHTEEAKSLDNLSTEDLERLIAETEGVTPSVIDNEPDEPSIKVIQPSEEDDPLSVV